MFVEISWGDIDIPIHPNSNPAVNIDIPEYRFNPKGQERGGVQKWLKIKNFGFTGAEPNP